MSQHPKKKDLQNKIETFAVQPMKFSFLNPQPFPNWHFLESGHAVNTNNILSLIFLTYIYIFLGGNKIHDNDNAGIRLKES